MRAPQHPPALRRVNRAAPAPQYNAPVRTPLPLRRWSINVLCGLSLLIFLLAMGIWVRSYFDRDRICHSSGYRISPDAPDSVRFYTNGIGWKNGIVILQRFSGQ